MSSLLLNLNGGDYHKMTTLNKVVDARLVKLKRFLNSYNEDLSYHKKHEVLGAIKELGLIQNVLNQLCVID